MKKLRFVFLSIFLFVGFFISLKVSADLITNDPEKDLAINKDIKTARTDYQNSKQFFRDANINWEKYRDLYLDDKSEENLANAKKYAKQLIEQTIDVLDHYYDLVIARVDIFTGLEAADKQSLLADIDSEKEWLQTQRVAISESNDASQIKNVAATLNNYRQNKSAFLYKIVGLIASSRVKKSLNLINDAALRVEDVIANLTEMEKNTNTLKIQSDLLTEKINQTQEKYSTALNGFRSLSSVTTAKADFDGQLAVLKESSNLLTEANTILANTVTELKAIKAAKIGGTGKLSTNGAGTILISGNVTVALTAADSADITMWVYDRAGDISVTTSPTAKAEASGRKTIYTEFSTGTITGTDLVVLIKGSAELTASGEGRAFLSGTGTYDTAPAGGTETYDNQGVVFNVSS